MHRSLRGVELAAQAHFHRVAGFRLQAGVADAAVVHAGAGGAGEAVVDLVGRRRPEATRVLHVGGGRRREGIHQRQLGRQRPVAAARLRAGVERVARVARRQAITVVAQGRDDAQAAAADLVLHKGAQQRVSGIGKDLVGEVVGRGRPGARAVAVDARDAGVDAVHQLVRERACQEAAFQLRRQAEGAVAVVVVARALRCGVGFVLRLLDLGTPEIDQAMDALEPAVVGIGVVVVEADTLVLQPVGRPQAAQRGGDGRQCVAVDALAHRLAGQLEGIAGRGLEHQLAEQRRVVGVLGVGRGAGGAHAAVAALVVDRVPAPAVGDQHALEPFAAQGGGDRGAEAAIGRVVARAQPEVRRLAEYVQQVLRVLGGEVDRAGQPVAAIQRRGRPAQDLDAAQ